MFLFFYTSCYYEQLGPTSPFSANSSGSLYNSDYICDVFLTILKLIRISIDLGYNSQIDNIKLARVVSLVFSVLIRSEEEMEPFL